MQVTYKAVKDYIYCPYRYYLIHRSGEKVAPLSINEEFAFTIKKAAFEYFSEIKKGRSMSEEELRKIFGDLWYNFSQARDMIFREEGINDKRRKLELKAVTYLNIFFRQMRHSKAVPLLVNHKYNLEIPGTESTVTGHIDLVRQTVDERRGTIVEILDIRPGRYEPNPFSIAHDIDLDMATYAYRRLFDIREHDAGIYYLEDGKIVYSKRTPNELDKFDSSLKSIVTCMEKEVYYPRYSPFCSGCQVRDLCNKLSI